MLVERKSSCNASSDRHSHYTLGMCCDTDKGGPCTWSFYRKQRLVISLDRFSGENAPETPATRCASLVQYSIIKCENRSLYKLVFDITFFHLKQIDTVFFTVLSNSLFEFFRSIAAENNGTWRNRWEKCTFLC